MKKVTKDEIEMILREMARAEVEHPKAKVYYSFEDNEVRITYPLPFDLREFTKHPGKIT